MTKESESFDWTDWRFRDNDPELEQFNNQLGLTTLGSFAPRQAPTVFNPLITLNPVPKATLFHEMTHRELTRATTFGLLFEVLYSLGNLKRFGRLAKICYQHQWQVQEACATYAGLTLIANHQPTYLSEAVSRLPAGKAKEPPYREVFDALAEVVPFVAGEEKSRLMGKAIFVTAIGHCSMNNDCLVRFADPRDLDEEKLVRYLKQESPNRRFKTILTALHGDSSLDATIDRAYRDYAEGRVTPVRPAISQIARLVPDVPIVQTFEDIGVQHARFRQGWRTVWASLPSDQRFNKDGAGTIPQIDIPVDYGPRPLTIEDVREHCADAQKQGHGLWAVINIAEKRLTLDLMPYLLGVGANPLSDIASAKSVLSVGFKSGQFAVRDVIAVFDEFPSLPSAITFMRGSWFYWGKASNGHCAGMKSIQVCLDRGLSNEGLQIMLAFRNLRKTSKYFILKFDDDQAVAVVADPKVPGYYVLQYLAGDVGVVLFKTFVSDFGIKEMDEYENKVPHIPLLKLMAFPAFLATSGRDQS